MKTYLLLFLSLLWSQLRSQTEYPYISFMRERLTNHSYVNMALVGSDSDTAVECHTDLITCCLGSDIHRGSWYSPHGEQLQHAVSDFYENHGTQQVDLLRENNAASRATVGIYHCDIPTNNEINSKIYVGLYASGGVIKISKFTVSKDILTCISVGGPATTVTWTRDSIEVTQGTETVLDDPLNGGYTHTLNVTVTGRQGGLYTCSVANNKPSSDSASITVQAYDTLPPSDVRAFQNGSSSVLVSWSPSSNAHGYDIHYVSRCRGLSGSFRATSGSTDEYILTDLPNPDSYTISIVATSDGFPSEILMVTGVLVYSDQFVVTATSTSLSWTSAGSEDVSYEVMWETDDIGGCSGGSDMSSTTITDDSTSYYIMGLEEDSCYIITVKTINLTDYSEVRDSVTTKTLTLETPPFASPPNVSVSEVTSSSITVQWGPVHCIHRNGDITGYSVQYGSKTVSVSGDSSGGMYVISDLMPSTAYSIQVAAQTRAGTGPYSTAMYYQTEIAAPVLAAGTTTATSIYLSWTSAGSEDVSYEVIWRTNNIGGCSGGSDMKSTTITDGSTSYDIMGLEEDSSYTITVIASNSVGSAVSNMETVATLVAAPSAPPSSVSLSEVTSSNITVQWGPVDCIHRNGDITGYSVLYVSETVSVSGDSSGGMYVISGLMPSTNYSIQVAAETSTGTGPYSAAIYLLTNVAAPILSAGSKTATSISLSWTSAGSEDVSYEVMWETDDIGGCSGGSDMDSTTITDGSTSYDIMGLEEDSSYTITVTASNSAGGSSVSNTLTKMTLQAVPTGPLSSISTTATFTTITVQWGPVDCIHRNGDITGYSVRVMRNGDILKNVSVSGDIRQVTILELSSFTEYNVSVAAVNINGTGVYSENIAQGTLSSVSISAISDTSLTIDGLSQNYTISYSNNDCPNDSYDDIIAITGTMYTLTDLEEGTNYSVTVTARLSDGGTEEYSLTATTMTAAPSAPPSNVSVSQVTSSSITVQWGPVDCIHRNGDITGYSVQYMEVVNGSFHNMTVPGSNTIDAIMETLMPSTMYIVQVAAINDAGYGVYSDPLTVSTNEHSVAAMYTAAMTGEPMTTETRTSNGSDNILVAIGGGIGTVALITAAIAVTVLVMICRRGYRPKREAARSTNLTLELSKIPQDHTYEFIDAFHTTVNEAYNVVDPTARVTEAVYETVPVSRNARRNVPPSASL